MREVCFGSTAHLGQSDTHNPVNLLGPSASLPEDTDGGYQVAAHGGKGVE